MNPKEDNENICKGPLMPQATRQSIIDRYSDMGYSP